VCEINSLKKELCVGLRGTVLHADGHVGDE
jgi:prepilin-type processing-associated H-X9-DG protein